jgi:hypothetical protein
VGSEKVGSGEVGSGEVGSGAVGSGEVGSEKVGIGAVERTVGTAEGTVGGAGGVFSNMCGIFGIVGINTVGVSSRNPIVGTGSGISSGCSGSSGTSGINSASSDSGHTHAPTHATQAEVRKDIGVIEVRNEMETVLVGKMWKDIDLRRAVEMGLIRACVVTPFSQTWFNILASWFPGPQVTVVRVLAKVVLDQSFCMPAVILLVFCARAGFKLDPQYAVDSARESFLDTFWAGLHYWPLMHVVNFSSVPLRFQPLFAAVASLYWNAVLSFYANKKALKEQKEEGGKEVGKE